MVGNVIIGRSMKEDEKGGDGNSYDIEGVGEGISDGVELGVKDVGGEGFRDEVEGEEEEEEEEEEEGEEGEDSDKQSRKK